MSLSQPQRFKSFIFTSLDRLEMSPDQAPHLETTEDRRVLPHVRRTSEVLTIEEVQILKLVKFGQTGNVA